MAAAIGIAKTATEIFLGVGEVSIDNLTFKLHYRYSVTLLVAASVLVQTSQFFGDPVQCETGEDSVDDDVLNSYCWMYSSFDIPDTFNFPCTRKKDNSGVPVTHLYNTYYQWVSIFLAVQAGLFYIPRCIWLIIEGGLMSYMVKGTTNRRFVYDAEEKIGKMLKLFQEHVHNKFNRYAFGFFLCELMNMVFALLSVFMTHKFLLDQYLPYGLDVYRYYTIEPEERIRLEMNDPMCEVFPKMAACRYQRYGMGGREDNRHAICILGLNMVNDKVFIVLWIWHCFICTVGIIRILTRTSQLVSGHVRLMLMKMRLKQHLKNNAHTKHIQYYILHCSIGDWFVLYQMSKNLNKRFFAEFITILALTVNPDPTIEPEEPEIYLTEADLERRRVGSRRPSRNGSFTSGSSNDFGADNEEEDEDDPHDPRDPRGRGSALHTNSLLRVIEGGDMENSIDRPDGVPGLGGKKRMLMKQGKTAMSAKNKAMMAGAAAKRLRN